MKKILLIFAFCVTASNLAGAQTTVSYSFASLGAQNGLNAASPGVALDSNVGFGSFKNSGTVNPVISANQLRLYQNAIKGGSIIIYVSNNVTVTNVTINASGTTWDAGYTVDGSSVTNLSRSNAYNISGINAVSQIEFFARDGSSSSNRIYVDSFDVTYTSGTGNQAPAITNLLQSPSGLTVTSTQAVTVAANVTDDAGLTSVKMLYDVSVNGIFSGSYGQEITMTNVASDYTGDIPAQANGSTVFYVVQAIDNDSTTPLITTTAQFSYTVQNPVSLSVIINEMSQGASGNKEWVELLVIEDNLDMRGYELGDNDDGFFISFATFSNDANWASVAAGTLIVVYNGADKDNILLDDADFSDNVVILASDNATYFTGSWEAFANSDSDDAAAIRDNNDVMIHDIAVTHPTATITAPRGNQAKAYLGTTAVTTALASPSNWGEIVATAATPGTGNGLSNTIYVNTLQGITSYVYDGTAWTPPNPEMNATNMDNVIVQAGAVLLTGDLDARALTIVNGATLNAGANSLNVARDINVYGTLVAGEATVNAAGTQIQNIAGNPFSLENLTINNGSGLVLNTPINLEGLLTLTNGALTTNDNLTFKSTSSTTAAVAPVLSGSVNGNITVEQFYPAKRAFRLVTPSVAMSATIFQQWQQAGLNASDSGFLPGTGTHITGGTSLNGFDQTATNNPSAFLYNNATQAWQSLNNTNQALTTGSPLRLFIRGDRTVNITGNTPAATATKLVSSGTVRIGDVNVTGLATAVGGYSLIGNPYQAQVDLVAALQDPTTVDIGKNFFYIWDPTLGARGAYSTFNIIVGANNIAGSQVNRFLQPGQAVFLDTADTDSNGLITPSLTVKETHKAGSSVTTGTYFNSHPVAGLRLNLFATSELASGIARDGVMLHFETTGNNGIDHKDAKKFTNLDENLAVVVGTAKLAVASHAVPIDGERISLYLSGLGSMDYTFAVSLDNNVGCTVSLEDTHTGQSHPISAAGATITFTPAASNATRFYLKFMDNTLGSDDTAFAKAITLYPNPNDGQTMHLQGFKKSDEVQVYLRNMAGQLLFSEKSMPLNGVLNIYGLPILSKGLYIVEIIQGTQKTLLKNSIN